MTGNEYQERAHETAMYGGNVMYPILEVSGEAGELASAVAKFVRKNDGKMPSPGIADMSDEMLEAVVVTDEESRERLRGWRDKNSELKERVKGELGDVLWNVAEVAGCFGLRLDEVMEYNLKKLAERKAAGCIKGSGETIAERKANGGNEK